MKRILLYPFLFSIYPVWALFANNIVFVEVKAIVRPSILSLIGTLVVFFISYALTKEKHKAGLISAIWTAFFFGYGHVYFLTEPFMRHRYLIFIWLGIFGCLVWLVAKKWVISRNISEILNIASVVLLMFPVIQTVSYYRDILFPQVWQTPESSGSHIIIDEAVLDQPLPDIYWIILDGYTRQDVLQKVWRFDNTEFIQELRDLNFYVADCSQTNYPLTHYSIPATLEMAYHPESIMDLSKKEGLLEVSNILWKDTAVMRTIRAAGYQVVSLANISYHPKGFEADIEYSLEEISRYQWIKEWSILYSGLTEFEVMLINTSLGLLITDGAVISPQILSLVTQIFNLPNEVILRPRHIFDDWHKTHYRMTQYTLSELENVPDIESPKFVMAHFLVPHDPYIFTPAGDYVLDSGDHFSGYVNNIKFINERIISILAGIIEKSEEAPIIILQGDHGWREHRVPILNAYHLPGGGNQSLYNSISPVNTFRVVFNQYFGFDYPLLEDISYGDTIEVEPLELLTSPAFVSENCP